MSCGRPHATDCRTVLEAVYLYLDGEVDVAKARLITEHLDECAPCLRLYGIEREVKALVARCCGHESAPSRLREKILLQIRQSVRIRMTEGS
jgi:mycothiol system anti-sigma-R factor